MSVYDYSVFEILEATFVRLRRSENWAAIRHLERVWMEIWKEYSQAGKFK